MFINNVQNFLIQIFGFSLLTYILPKISNTVISISVLLNAHFLDGTIPTITLTESYNLFCCCFFFFFSIHITSLVSCVSVDHSLRSHTLPRHHSFSEYPQLYPRIDFWASEKCWVSRDYFSPLNYFWTKFIPYSLYPSKK